MLLCAVVQKVDIDRIKVYAIAEWIKGELIQNGVILDVFFICNNLCHKVKENKEKGAIRIDSVLVLWW